VDSPPSLTQSSIVKRMERLNYNVSISLKGLIKGRLSINYA